MLPQLPVVSLDICSSEHCQVSVTSHTQHLTSAILLNTSCLLEHRYNLESLQVGRYFGDYAKMPSQYIFAMCVSGKDHRAEILAIVVRRVKI